MQILYLTEGYDIQILLHQWKNSPKLIQENGCTSSSLDEQET